MKQNVYLKFFVFLLIFLVVITLDFVHFLLVANKIIETNAKYAVRHWLNGTLAVGHDFYTSSRPFQRQQRRYCWHIYGSSVVSLNSRGMVTGGFHESYTSSRPLQHQQHRCCRYASVFPSCTRPVPVPERYIFRS